MTITHIIILLVTGLGTGFASGLLGMGGSFIMIPVQYILFTNMGMSTNIAMKLASGTSLLVVLPTVASGAWRHNRKGAVWWKAAIIMGLCGSVSAYGGATLATHLPGAILKIIFGAVVLAGGVWMLIRKPIESSQESKVLPEDVEAAQGMAMASVHTSKMFDQFALKPERGLRERVWEEEGGQNDNETTQY